jgi:hypothetical protein
MTKNEYQELLKRGSSSFKRANQTDSPVPNPKPEPHQKAALERATARETPGLERPVIRFTGFRVRPCDPDNFAASCKDLLDGLRHAGLIPGDEPWKIVFQTQQFKVRSVSQEKTEIEIIYPDTHVA